MICAEATPRGKKGRGTLSLEQSQGSSANSSEREVQEPRAHHCSSTRGGTSSSTSRRSSSAWSSCGIGSSSAVGAARSCGGLSRSLCRCLWCSGSSRGVCRGSNCHIASSSTTSHGRSSSCTCSTSCCTTSISYSCSRPSIAQQNNHTAQGYHEFVSTRHAVAPMQEIC